LDRTFEWLGRSIPGFWSISTIPHHNFFLIAYVNPHLNKNDICIKLCLARIHNPIRNREYIEAFDLAGLGLRISKNPPWTVAYGRMRVYKILSLGHRNQPNNHLICKLIFFPSLPPTLSRFCILFALLFLPILCFLVRIRPKPTDAQTYIN
jgi:hypothetical protein